MPATYYVQVMTGERATEQIQEYTSTHSGGVRVTAPGSGLYTPGGILMEGSRSWTLAWFMALCFSAMARTQASMTCLSKVSNSSNRCLYSFRIWQVDDQTHRSVRLHRVTQPHPGIRASWEARNSHRTREAIGPDLTDGKTETDRGTWFKGFIGKARSRD